MTHNDANTKAIMSYYNVVAPPAFLFYNAEGQALDKLQLVGEVSTDVFLNRLMKAMD